MCSSPSESTFMFKLWPNVHLCFSISPRLSTGILNQYAVLAFLAAEQHVCHVQPVPSEQRGQEAEQFREAFTDIAFTYAGARGALKSTDGLLWQDRPTMRVYVNAVGFSLDKMICTEETGVLMELTVHDFGLWEEPEYLQRTHTGVVCDTARFGINSIGPTSRHIS